jgi:two-component system OmpR family response regulator
VCEKPKDDSSIMPRNEPTILIVEDDRQVADLLAEHVSAALDAHVIRAAGAAEALQLDSQALPDLAMIDLLLPDGNGLDLIRVLRPAYPVLLMTAQPTAGRAIEALRLGVRDLLTKPFDLQRLTAVIREQLAVHHRSERQRVRQQRQQRVIRKVLQERRALQERIDLLCTDLVSAYRDLAAKVSAHSR